MQAKIKEIKAKKILNSRGEWTLEVLAKSKNYQVRAGVPAGASTGKYEAKVVEIKKAIKNVNEIIGPKLKGLDPTRQREIDELLIELDGTKNKSHLGGNAIVGVSMAISKLGAKIQNLPLWLHLSNFCQGKTGKILPRACFNVINGGKHSGSNLAIQEFMIVPERQTFSQDLESALKIYHQLKTLIKNKYGKSAVNLGDEGGFVPPISSAIEALELLAEVIDKKTKIILDCAATHFFKDGQYYLEGTTFTKKGLLCFYEELIKKYPIIGLEDPFAEDDFEGWRMANLKLKIANCEIIIGDDLLVTNQKRIKMAKKKNLCNGAIIKINQIGTVSEAIEAVRLAKSFGWKIIVSHRSGETNDDFIADFAVGVGADFIKAGAPARGERVAKYNRLLEIKEELLSFE